MKQTNSCGGILWLQKLVLNRTGYHGAVVHSGAISSPSAWSLCHLHKTLCSQLKGGKTYRPFPPQSSVKASTAQTSGWGRQGTYGLIWKWRRDASKSISGHANLCVIFLKMFLSSFHSVLSFKCLDSASASSFSVPGVWLTGCGWLVVKNQLSIYLSEMSLNIFLQTGCFIWPCFFKGGGGANVSMLPYGTGISVQGMQLQRYAVSVFDFLVMFFLSLHDFAVW